MIEKDIDTITKDDLQYLVDNSISEKKTLEYKLKLPGNSDKEKTEFLCDVSSIANASGGDIIYGIREDRNTGFPACVEGIEIANSDFETRRLESMIKDGIKPRVPSSLIQIKTIDLFDSRKALIVRINKSWIGPHRVVFKGDDGFYSRNQTSRYKLDVEELRAAFTYPEIVQERIRRFREQRISNILADEIPVMLRAKTRVSIHLIPLSSFGSAQVFDLVPIEEITVFLRPISSRGWDHYYNFDGFLTLNNRQNTTSYVQFFRNGCIEAVTSGLLEPYGDELTIASVAYELDIIEAVKTYINQMKKLNISPPILIFISLLNVKGYRMLINNHGSSDATIDRDTLLLPVVTIEKYGVEIEKILKPCFDTVWNACGLPFSYNYDKNGNWKMKN